MTPDLLGWDLDGEVGGARKSNAQSFLGTFFFWVTDSGWIQSSPCEALEGRGCMSFHGASDSTKQVSQM